MLRFVYTNIYMMVAIFMTVDVYALICVCLDCANFAAVVPLRAKKKELSFTFRNKPFGLRIQEPTDSCG